MLCNIIAETSSVNEDVNFFFTELLLPGSFLGWIVALIVFGGAICLYVYAEMPQRKAVGSFITLIAIFTAFKWAYYYHELPAKAIADGHTQLEVAIIWTLLIWVIMKIIRWCYNM